MSTLSARVAENVMISEEFGFLVFVQCDLCLVVQLSHILSFMYIIIIFAVSNC